jgi:hypothetical protein
MAKDLRRGRYVPISVIAERDPDAVERIRAYARAKRRRLRAADPDRTRAIGREQYAKNQEKMREQKRIWKQANPDSVRSGKDKYWAEKRAKYLVSHVRGRAKGLNLDFDLTEEWFEKRLSAGICEMSGLPFDLVGKWSKDSPSIDRKEPAGPYTQDNCRLVLWSINRALCNYGEDYLLGVFRHILARHDAR